MRRPGPFHLYLAGSGMLIALLILLPIGALLLASSPMELAHLLGDHEVLQAIRITLLASLLALPPILLFGLPAAYGLSRLDRRRRRGLEMLLELPLVMPPVVAGLALLLAFGRRGLLGDLLAGVGLRLPFTLAAVVIAILFIVTPSFVRRCSLLFDSLDHRLEEAALLLGATPHQVFFRVSLPLARRGLVAETIMAQAQGIGLFGAVILFAGNLPGRTQTLSLAIYSAFESDPPRAFALGSLLLLISLLLLGAVRLVTPRGPKP
ncbi:molybdate transport system permease protein [Geothermobacter ehrlichii]|uniref:Molybdate transport system permease protein n=1 Tax=Geothermobacter ehrlichii TaxID=213224 RepID=A0A5D3WGP0_9BACT|nr:ABC transporter permease subunit [Geothermobacter ehrlichii]TYO96694.1 molybdate transport system permease protein [Geothermobacter ehrlichii]